MSVQDNDFNKKWFWPGIIINGLLIKFYPRVKRRVAREPALKYPMKIQSHNILLERSLQDNDFGTNSYDDYLNIQVKF